MSIADDLKARYQGSTLLMRFIYINIAVFVVLRLVGFISFLATGSSATLVQWVEMPSNFHDLLRRPWTLITYMFSHYEVLHILFNMLWLYWLGRIFLQFFNPRQLGGLYVLGGAGGAALYLVCYNLIPHMANQHSLLIGASASVLAIVVAIAIYRPDYPISLLFFGNIALKWIAIITVFIDIVGIENNMGGHIAHLGGALVGLWFGLAIKHGHDITSWINRCIDSVVTLFKKRQPKSPRPKKSAANSRSFKYHKSSSSGSSAAQPKNAKSQVGDVDEEKLDEILGKLKQSGYAALTDEERDFLFNASRKR